jgi:hypothetical protein
LDASCIRILRFDNILLCAKVNDISAPEKELTKALL